MNVPALFGGRKRVYVDAKILGMHDVSLPKFAYVGYFVEDSKIEPRARRSDAMETDDAEIDAILFAIEDLRRTLKRFTIICDHQSVVSEANREGENVPKNPRMVKLREALYQNRSFIRLEPLKANPAHGSLTKSVNEQKI